MLTNITNCYTVVREGCFMREKMVDIVYDLIIGQRICQPGDPEVEDMFSPGRECANLYKQVYEANLHLCNRLNTAEDKDVETIINSLLEICSIVGKRMYRYGVEFGHE